MMDAHTGQRRKKVKQRAGKLPSLRLGIMAAMLPVAFLAMTVVAQEAPSRPRILGIAHVAFYVSDLGKERAFYKDFLAYDEPFSLRRQDGREWISFIKFNDFQYLELFAEDPRFAGLLYHIAIYTDDVAAMKTYLLSRRVTLVGDVHSGRTGDKFFTVRDPGGHLIEIVQYQPEGWNARNRGAFLPPARISDHITHVALTETSLREALAFYTDILGCRQVGQDMSSGAAPAWIEARLPEGSDYLRLVRVEGNPNLDQLKAQTYVGLKTTDIDKSVADLRSRAGGAYTRALEVQTTQEGRRAASLFDPNGARFDLTETAPAKSTSGATPPR